MDKLIEKHLYTELLEPFETSAEKHANITKEIAIGFAEWLMDEGYYNRITNNLGSFRESSKHGHLPFNKRPRFTISELFDIYIKSLQK